MSPADMMEGNLPWQVEVHFACRPSQKAMNPQVSITLNVEIEKISKVLRGVLNRRLKDKN